jgi:hypothetical protein
MSLSILSFVLLPDHGGLGFGLGEQIKSVVLGTPVFDVRPIEGVLASINHLTISSPRRISLAGRSTETGFG